MNRQQAKELLPIIQAFADGKVIQYRPYSDLPWKDMENGNFNDNRENYRIKPETVKYRRYLQRGNTQLIVSICHAGVSDPYVTEKRGEFVRWIDNDWIEQEI